MNDFARPTEAAMVCPPADGLGCGMLLAANFRQPACRLGEGYAVFLQEVVPGIVCLIRCVGHGGEKGWKVLRFRYFAEFAVPKSRFVVYSCHPGMGV